MFWKVRRKAKFFVKCRNPTFPDQPEMSGAAGNVGICREMLGNVEKCRERGKCREMSGNQMSGNVEVQCGGGEPLRENHNFVMTYILGATYILFLGADRDLRIFCGLGHIILTSQKLAYLSHFWEKKLLQFQRPF